MELIIFLFAVAFVSVASFWLMGMLYGLIHRPAIYFPISLAAKMAAGAVVGVWFIGVGGIALATFIFNAEMKKRQDYNLWPVVIAGATISILCSVAIYFSVLALAWEIFD